MRKTSVSADTQYWFKFHFYRLTSCFVLAATLCWGDGFVKLPAVIPRSSSWMLLEDRLIVCEHSKLLFPVIFNMSPSRRDLSSILQFRRRILPVIGIWSWVTLCRSQLYHLVIPPESLKFQYSLSCCSVLVTKKVLFIYFLVPSSALAKD